MFLDDGQLREVDEYLASRRIAPIFQLNKDLRITAANRYARELLGESVTCSYFSEIVVTLNESVDIEALIKSGMRGQLLTLDVKGSVPRSYLFDSYHFPKSTLVLGQSDTGEIAKLQDELLATNQELNNLTRELHQKNRQLRQLNEYKNQMLGMAVHDIRHPLAVVKMYSRFVQEECGEGMEKHHLEFLQNIQSSALAMEHILDDFLDYSVLESGRLNIEREEVDLVTFLKDLVHSYNILFKSRNLRVQFDSNLDVAWIKIDRSKIAQVMNNLVENAANHSDNHDCITIALEKGEKNMSIAVQDSGVGIASGDLQQIFKPFKRTQEPGQGRKVGTGLGLAIAQKIIHQHDGTIDVTSSPGAGATFTVTLPLIEPPQQ